ncbi:UDP-3-O-acylglucosamine N-acyltransferase [bioreactor metagenome]|uniref:UDP-3-O-acylglucosamine N-acyltransferase n=1 Tax=bioreactor metagenome TaxID=1076179 RepID=A0A644TPM4_9ZZZZ
MKLKLSDVADIVNGSVVGDGSIEITGVAGLDTADENDITFAVPPHLEKAVQTKAAAIIIPDSVTEFSKPAIRVENPRMAFTKLLEVFTPQVPISRGVHNTVVIGQGVKLGKNVAIMALAVLADNVVIGDNAIIYPHTYIGHNTEIGNDAIIYPNVTVRENCRVGNNVIIHSGAVIGSDGFGFVTEKGEHQKVPQVGNVLIEDDVEIGANVTIDRATTSSTIVKRGTKIDNLVHLAHNVILGENCLLVAQTGIAGSVKTGHNVTFAGQAGSAGHITIGDNCTFAARSAPISDVESGSFYAGFPARPHREWIKAEAALYKVPDLLKKVRELEKRLTEMENK